MTTTSSGSAPAAALLCDVPKGSSGSGAEADGLIVSFILLCPSDLSVWQTLGERFFPSSILAPQPPPSSPPPDPLAPAPAQSNFAHSAGPPHQAVATLPPAPDKSLRPRPPRDPPPHVENPPPSSTDTIQDNPSPSTPTWPRAPSAWRTAYEYLSRLNFPPPNTLVQ